MDRCSAIASAYAYAKYNIKNYTLRWCMQSQISTTLCLKKRTCTLSFDVPVLTLTDLHLLV